LHEYSGQWTGVSADIVDDTRGVEYTLLNGTKVGAGPQQPAMYAHKTFSYLEKYIEPQHHHKEVPYTPEDAKMLHVDGPLTL
jgi:hypothetical protein